MLCFLVCPASMPLHLPYLSIILASALAYYPFDVLFHLEFMGMGSLFAGSLLALGLVWLRPTGSLRRSPAVAIVFHFLFTCLTIPAYHLWVGAMVCGPALADPEHDFLGIFAPDRSATATATASATAAPAASPPAPSLPPEPFRALPAVACMSPEHLGYGVVAGVLFVVTMPLAVLFARKRCEQYPRMFPLPRYEVLLALLRPLLAIVGALLTEYPIVLSLLVTLFSGLLLLSNSALQPSASTARGANDFRAGSLSIVVLAGSLSLWARLPVLAVPFPAVIFLLLAPVVGVWFVISNSNEQSRREQQVVASLLQGLATGASDATKMRACDRIIRFLDDIDPGSSGLLTSAGVVTAVMACLRPESGASPRLTLRALVTLIALAQFQRLRKQIEAAAGEDLGLICRQLEGPRGALASPDGEEHALAAVLALTLVCRSGDMMAPTPQGTSERVVGLVAAILFAAAGLPDEAASGFATSSCPPPSALHPPDPVLVFRALNLLVTVCANNPEIKIMAVERGLGTALVPLLSTLDPQVQGAAAMAVGILAGQAGFGTMANRLALAQQGCVPHLSALLEMSRTPDLVTRALIAIENLAYRCPDNQTLLRQCGVLGRLEAMLSRGPAKGVPDAVRERVGSVIRTITTPTKLPSLDHRDRLDSFAGAGSRKGSVMSACSSDEEQRRPQRKDSAPATPHFKPLTRNDSYGGGPGSPLVTPSSPLRLPRPSSVTLLDLDAAASSSQNDLLLLRGRKALSRSNLADIFVTEPQDNDADLKRTR